MTMGTGIDGSSTRFYATLGGILAFRAASDAGRRRLQVQVDGARPQSSAEGALAIHSCSGSSRGFIIIDCSYACAS